MSSTFFLQAHIRIHTGEKPFTCIECNKAFRAVSQLRVHSRSHTGEKPYKCPNCDKAFKWRKSFETHMKLTHWGGDPGEAKETAKIHACLYEGCPKKYRSPGELADHMRGHTGEKPHVCAECGKGFATVRKHKIHMKRSHSTNGLKLLCPQASFDVDLIVGRWSS